MKHVIIVGAGASGLAAASRLVENGVDPLNITILEAQNRIGGRIHTITNDGYPYELGAQWVHGQQGNIVFEMGKAAHELNINIETTESSGYGENVVFGFEDYRLNKEHTQRLMQMVESLKKSSQQDFSKRHKSLGEYLERKFNEQIDGCVSASNIDRSIWLAFFDWYHLFENVIDGSDDWKETCGSGHLHYRECDGDPLVTWKRGYSALFEILMKNIPKCGNGIQLPLSDRILLNKAVKKIKWDTKRDEMDKDQDIRVICEDGTVFRASFVLVTSSLGYLKANADTIFSPILPPVKRRAIKGLGFGTVDKIFLKFEKPWWPQDWGGISLLRQRSTKEKHWSENILGFYTVRLQPNLLIAWITGKAAREAELLPAAEVMEVCSDLLRKYVHADFTYLEPKEIIRSTWFCNRFSLGSYSYRSIESKEMNVWASDLALPVYDSKGYPRLFFAGEATHDHFYSTVHGAVETGWREGDRIAKYCNASQTAKL